MFTDEELDLLARAYAYILSWPEPKTAPSERTLTQDLEEAADDEPALGGSIDEDYSIEVPPEAV